MAFQKIIENFLVLCIRFLEKKKPLKFVALIGCVVVNSQAMYFFYMYFIFIYKNNHTI
jgi:hypothetical protein